MNTCTKCGEEKPLAEFHPIGRRLPNKLRTVCRTCHAKAGKEAYALHREEILRKQKEYRTANPGVSRKNRIKFQYGVTPEWEADTLREQGGVCAVCELPCPVHANLSIDHDHKTGKVRAMLCSMCNRGLGSFRDNIALLDRASAYLEKYA